MAEEIFNHVEEIVDFNYYDEKQCAQFLPAYYQFMTEYGYYGFDTTGISHLLSHKNLTNLTFCPKDAALHYDGTYMKEMTRKAERKIKNTILIYGENDTWTACALEPRKTANVLKYVKSGGGHRTRIRNLNSNEKNHPHLYEKAKQYETSNKDGSAQNFTWIQGGTLEQILKDEDGIKRRHDQYETRVKRDKQKKSKRLIDVFSSELSFEDALNMEDDAEGCLVCHV